MPIWDPHRKINKQRFGRLTVKKRRHRQNYSWWWECECDCGRRIICDVNDLLNRKITECAVCSLQKTIKEEIKEIKRKENAANKDGEENKGRGRKNAENERRLILLAIENISSTKTARLQGTGAPNKLIEEYTKLPEAAIKTGTKWLQNKGIIYAPGSRGWLVKETPKENFCFKHGYVELIGGKCIKCLNEKGY